MNTGQIIKKYRKEKKMTQKELGEIVGKAEITIRKYENENVNPPLNTLINIANVLHIPLELFNAIQMEEVDESKHEIAPGIYAYGRPEKDEVSLEEMINRIFEIEHDPWIYKSKEEVINTCAAAIKFLESQGIQVFFYKEIDMYGKDDFLVFLIYKKYIKSEYIYYKEFLLECEKIAWFIESEINTLFKEGE